jgi:large subunit ribosomal protein L3
MSGLTAIVGQKLGMTQVFDEDAQARPVTVIKAGPVRVVQIKTPDKDGYSAVQVAFGEVKASRVNQPTRGHYDKAGVAPAKALLEIRVPDSSEYQVGQEIAVADVFEVGQKADVTGTSKGKGFAGVMKRHNFSGQGGSHGNHKKHRAPGSIGACATPARVFKGMRMAGRMGNDQVTTLNLEVVGVDTERGLLLLGGSVPGAKGAYVVVREAVKARV